MQVASGPCSMDQKSWFSTSAKRRPARATRRLAVLSAWFSYMTASLGTAADLIACASNLFQSANARLPSAYATLTASAALSSAQEAKALFHWYSGQFFTSVCGGLKASLILAMPL